VQYILTQLDYQLEIEIMHRTWWPLNCQCLHNPSWDFQLKIL